MRVLTLVSVVLLTAALASAAPIWSLDFENGFTASSGTPNVNYGDLSDPYNTAGDPNNNVHVETDPLDTSNTALDIDMTVPLPRSRLTYLDVPSELSTTGQITIKNRWYYGGGYNYGGDMWSLSPGIVDSNVADDGNFIELLLGAGSTQTVWTLDIWVYALRGDPINKWAQRTRFAMPILGAGWHDISASWVYLGILGDGNPYARVTASVDSTNLGTFVTRWANDWDVNMLNIGNRWKGGDGTASKQIDSTEMGTLVDDYVITPEPATALLLLSGCVLFRKRR